MNQEKISIRNTIKEQMRHLTTEKVGEMSLAFVPTLLQHPHIKEAQTILLYCALPTEVQTLQLIKKLKEMGKNIVLPVVTGETTMEIRIFTDEKDLKEGPFGILEPQGKVLSNLPLIDIAIIPGLAFSADGKRLGRGKGYYDRLLKHIPQCYKIGICFSFQLINHIPTTQYDVMMNEVIAL